MIYLADTNKAFVQAIKDVENNYAIAKKRKEYRDVQGEWRWFPGKSPEGGLPTLAWGHKFTPKEWETKRIEYVDPKLNQMVSKDFRFGITDEMADALLLRDLCRHELDAQDDWDKYIGIDQNLLYENLPDKYKGVLVNLCFNAGSLVKKGKWVWFTTSKGILTKNDQLVSNGMVTSYKKPDGTRVKLLTRAIIIAKALGLPLPNDK